MLRITTALTTLTLAAILAQPAAAQNPPGNVYVQTNDPAGNSVLVWNRGRDGGLTFQARYNTGGTGGGPLGSQGSVILTTDERFLLVTNIGDCSMTSFALNPRGGLQIVDKVLTTGDGPVSLTYDQGVIYVLHKGSAINDVRAFTLDANGFMANIPGSRRPLSIPKPGPAQVQFSPLGNWIVVTEKMTDKFLIYDVDPVTKLLGAPGIHASNGQTPFGFDFAADDLLAISEAWGGAAGAGSVSTYRITDSATVATVASSAASMQTATCWLKVTHDRGFAYASNTPDQSITGYSIDAAGNLTRLDASGVTGSTPAGADPVDVDITANDRYMYTCNTGDGSVTGFARNADGSLTALGTWDAGPGGIWGMAVR